MSDNDRKPEPGNEYPGKSQQSNQVETLIHARWIVDYLDRRAWRYQMKSGWLLTAALAVFAFLVLRIREEAEKTALVIALLACGAAIVFFIVSMLPVRISSVARGFIDWRNNNESDLENLVRTLTAPRTTDSTDSVITAIDTELEKRSNHFKYGVWSMLVGLLFGGIYGMAFLIA